MRRALSFMVPVSVLGLAVGLATAAPTARRSPRVPKPAPATCQEGPPSADKCLQEGYLESPCGKKYKAQCKDPVEQGLKAHYEANPSPLVKMLEPNGTDIPKNLREGKVVDYPGPSKRNLVGTFPKVGTVSGRGTSRAAKPSLKKRSMSTVPPTTGMVRLGTTRRKYNLSKKKVSLGTKIQTSDNIFSRTGLTRPPHSGLASLPTDAHRNPAWEANGDQITSCEEYAYEKVYDWARYTDAVAACAGDYNCQLDIAFLPDTPGIASRVLRGKDGTPTKTQIKYDKVKKLPKNDFFAYGSKFVYAAGPEGLPKSADLEALAKAVDDGVEHYQIGCSGTCRTLEYKDEWDFHRKMHDANRTVSVAEFEEYERRKARLRELISMHRAAVEKELAEGPGVGKAVQPWVSPIDMVTADPFERYDLMRGYAKQTARDARRVKGRMSPAQLNQMPGAGIRNAPVQQKTRVQGYYDPGPLPDFSGSEAPVSVLAVPQTKKRLPSSRPGTRGGTPTETQHIASMCDPKNFPHVMEMIGMGPISCQIGQFMRQEWERKKRGQKSCLDLDNDDCDWSPMMFEARFIEGVPYIAEQVEYEEYCLDYTNDKFSTPPESIPDADAQILAMKEAIGEAMRELEPYQKTQTQSGMGKGFGKGWTDADHFGDKALFAAGYDYDLGWDIEPVQVQGNEVCQLGGGARGGFGVDGWFINHRVEVVDALAKAEYNRAGDKKGLVHAHLNLFGGTMKVIDPEIDEHFNGAWEKPLGHGSIQVPPGFKPSINMMAGPVPVTMAVWGEFFYGAKLGLEPITEASCDMSKMKFGSKVIFTPEVGLNAKAQVGVGISGLLSAGIRGMVNLLTVGVPVEVTLSTKMAQIKNQLHNSLGFDLDVKLALSTLSGYLALYVEFLMFEEEFVLFRWNGLGPEEISLLGKPLQTELPLFVMAK